MKKKNLVILISGILLILAIALVLFIILRDNDFEKCTKQMKKSMDSVAKIETKATVSDSGIVVYGHNKELVLNGNTGELTTTISELNSSFVLADTTESETVENVKRSSLISFNINKSLISDYTFENDVLTCQVAKSNIAKILGLETFSIKDKATLVFTFKNKKIMSITCTFQTESSKDVVVSAVYSY